MEHVKGIPLADIWKRLDRHSFAAIAQFLVDYEVRLTGTEFPHLGSLYFAEEDLGKSAPSLPVIFNGFESETPVRKCKIGPSVDRRFWRGARAFMDMDRGPCEYLLEDSFLYSLFCFFSVVLKGGISHHTLVPWLVKKNGSNIMQNHTKSPAHCIDQQRRTIPKHLSLCWSSYEKLIPHLGVSRAIRLFSLWHPDLHTSNLIVSKSNNGETSGIIDWQTARIELLVQSGDIPDFLLCGGKYVPRPPRNNTTTSYVAVRLRFSRWCKQKNRWLWIQGGYTI